MIIPYTKVTERHRKIAIIATGASLKEVKLTFPDDVAVIGVNAAIYHYKGLDYWFTLDHSSSNIDIMRTRFKNLTYYAAMPENFRAVFDHVKYLKRITGLGHGRLKTKKGLARDKGMIHTGNSAWGALQLAVHMEPRKIGLFGVDGQGPYHYGGNPRDLTMMPELFASSVLQLKQLGIEVRNGSPKSLVDCFQRQTIQEVVQWLTN